MAAISGSRLYLALNAAAKRLKVWVFGMPGSPGGLMMAYTPALPTDGQKSGNVMSVDKQITAVGPVGASPKSYTCLVSRYPPVPLTPLMKRSGRGDIFL